MATATKANKETLATSNKVKSVTTATEPVKKVLRKKKLIKVSKADTDTKNIKDTVTKVVESNREMKYIYPDDVKGDPQKMKSFRAKARDKDKAYLKDLATATKKKEDTSKIDKAYKAWRKGIFLVP